MILPDFSHADFAPKGKSNSGMDLPIRLEDQIIQLKGRVRAWVIEDGQAPVLAHEKNNLIVQGARKALANLIAEAPAPYIVSSMHWGTAGHQGQDILTPVPPTINDVQLNVDAFQKSIQSFTYLPTPPNETSVQFNCTMEKIEGNGSGVVAYTEAGLFCTNGIMFARETFPAIVKNSARKVIFEWVILF